LPGPHPGVIISTQRPLRVQRFTGAHELGHVALGHLVSLDGEEILERGTADASDRFELAADSFAAAFLLPKWLLQMHAKRQGWKKASMADPRAVYQLSLRAGASYEATCIALERHGIIDPSTRQHLFSKPRRDIKKDLLDGFEVEDFRRDVWLLTERDEGTSIEGAPDDLFVLKLTENSGAGYLWTTAGLARAGFAILRESGFADWNTTSFTEGSAWSSVISAPNSTIVVGTNMLIGGLLKVIVHRSMLNCE
jgi:hypothetical protein